MKKILLLAASCLMLAACKKSDDGTSEGKNGSGAVKINFELRSPNAYINENVVLGLMSEPGVSFTIDYGDGTSAKTDGYPEHKYTAAGIYSVTVKAGSSSVTRKLRVFPGTSSYQVLSNFSRTMTGFTMQPFNTVTNANIGNAATIPQLTYNQISDTIFVNVPSSVDNTVSIRTSFNWVFVSRINFVVPYAFFISKSNHKIFTIDKELQGDYSYSGTSGSGSGSGPIKWADR